MVFFVLVLLRRGRERNCPNDSRKNGAKVLKELPTTFPQKFKWIVNQAYKIHADSSKKSECQVVFQNWVNACDFERGVVDEGPFVLREPAAMTCARKEKRKLEEEEAPTKRMKCDPYTKKEESTLIEFASKHKDDKDLNTQELLWNYAKTNDILPKRTAARCCNITPS